jgi:NAD(P)-dependent dehydrogenase (short-subunit alcohol dehydrogenase family)
VAAPGVALVTGAAGGIGSAVAAALASAGWLVAGTDLGGDGLAATGDVTRPDDVDRICDVVEAALGPVDVLVNAAGTYGERVPFTHTDPDRWWRVLETNLRGPALLCRRLVPGMVERARGHVVDIASKAAVWDDPGQSSVAYSVSKAGLVRFTGALAGELRGTGVVSFAVSPGMVRTGMTATRPDIAAIPDDWFVPATAVADVVVSLVSGAYDDLHGRFVHALDDLDQLRARVLSDPRVRTLSIVPHGDDDPVA